MRLVRKDPLDAQGEDDGMTMIALGPLREDRIDWPLPTIREDQLRLFLGAEGDGYQVWQHANVGPDIRIVGSADLRFGTRFYCRKE